MKSFFLVNDSRGQNNWGCQATTGALLDLASQKGLELVGSAGHDPHVDGSPIKRLGVELLRSYPAADRTVRSIARELERRRGVRVGRPQKLDDFQRVAERIDCGELWHRGLLEQMTSADAVLVNGEGSVYGTESKGFEELFFAWYAKTRLKKPVAMVNQTMDLSDAAMRRAAEETLPLLDDVSFREPVSLRKNLDLLPDGTPHQVVPDAAFSRRSWTRDEIGAWALEPGFFGVFGYALETFRFEDPYVAVTGSSAVNRPGAAAGDRRLLATEYAMLLSKLSRLGRQILLLAPDLTDLQFLAPLAKELRLPLVPTSVPLSLAHALLANADCLIGGRWHPGVLASSGGTPLVATTANTSKTTGLLEMLDLPPRVYPADSVGELADQITSAARQLIEQGDAERQRIRKIASRLAQESHDNLRLFSAAEGGG